MEMASYAEGAPCIVDLQAKDLDATRQFYEELFGWGSKHFPEMDGGPWLMTKDGKHVCTIAPVAPGAEAASLPLWNTYLAVGDLDATISRVGPSGGVVVSEPFDVLDKGRIAVIKDPSGGSVSLWEAGTLAGAELVDEPGALCWNELATRDPEAASRFFKDVLDLDAYELDTEVPSIELRSGGRPVAGIMIMNDAWPADLPAHWMAYFQVDDTDGFAARGHELGGGVSVPPTDIPRGRFAVLNDPEGNAFSVITPAS
jgi:predicted enzyme related to lactoylglutathione lyase